MIRLGRSLLPPPANTQPPRWPTSPAATTPANTGSPRSPCFCCRTNSSHTLLSTFLSLCVLCLFVAKNFFCKSPLTSPFHYRHENHNPFYLRLCLPVAQRRRPGTGLLPTEKRRRSPVRAGVVRARQRALFKSRKEQTESSRGA